jgi:hypothetical protein
LALAAGLLAGSGLGQAATSDWATFQESATATDAIGADVLAPPTGLVASATYCGTGTHQVDLSWSASASDWLDGYEVLLSTAAAGPYSVVPPPVDADPEATTRSVAGLERRTTCYFVVATTRDSWRAASDPVAVTTPARKCA